MQHMSIAESSYRSCVPVSIEVLPPTCVRQRGVLSIIDEAQCVVEVGLVGEKETGDLGAVLVSRQQHQVQHQLLAVFIHHLLVVVQTCRAYTMFIFVGIMSHQQLCPPDTQLSVRDQSRIRVEPLTFNKSAEKLSSTHNKGNSKSKAN